eukprot:1160027-Pelagomonas_calceolata.AAC.4
MAQCRHTVYPTRWHTALSRSSIKEPYRPENSKLLGRKLYEDKGSCPNPPVQPCGTVQSTS